MVVLQQEQNWPQPEQLASDHVEMVSYIASRLHRWYEWVAMDDLESYAYLGLAMATRKFQADRGVPFANFAAHKAMYLAIDEMRKAGILKRRSARPGPSTGMLDFEVPDPAWRQAFANIERKDMCKLLLGRLKDCDRKLLRMYYADQKPFAEIGAAFGLSESGVRQRHNTVMDRLRRMVRLM
ncbi:MAG: sigma-70 family RNA polymerase sigma factor [Phycisphaerales bacterium]|jgi:RNA polymerase sigma factor (sigma-70 family)|nr:sigma-70 family RNA polymerase sigma factor [Phycisphaerales bacterium]